MSVAKELTATTLFLTHPSKARLSVSLQILITAIFILVISAASILAAPTVPTYTGTYADDTTGNNEFISPSDGKKYWFIDAPPGDAGAGADNYYSNTYERPTIQTFQLKTHPTMGSKWASAEYFKYIDLVGGKIGKDNTYLYISLDLYGTDNSGKLPQEYSVELDVDGDLRGDFLFLADNPGSNNATGSYTQNAVFGHKDVNNDVGGTDPLLSQSNGDLINPGTMNGFELAFFSDANPYFWCRIDPTDPSIVEFAISHVALSAHVGFTINTDDAFVRCAGADKGIQDPQKYWFHDKYTISQAGTPYNEGYPIGNIYEYDNSCMVGMVDFCTNVNQPPQCDVPNDTSIFKCVSSQICLPLVITDVNNNFSHCTVVSGPGAISGTNWCYTPTKDTSFCVVTMCIDSCLATCTDTFCVTINLNDPPDAMCPGNSNMFVCNLNQICIPGFTATDPDNNIATKVVNNGTLTGSTVCFTPVVGNNLIRFIVTDSCGKADTCQTTVNVTLNSPPDAMCPGNSNMFVCNLNQICIPGFTATDPNNNIATKVVNNGTLTGSTVCFTPVVGNNLIRFIVTDSCGKADTCQTTVNVTLNSPPDAMCPGNSNMFVCNLNQICIPGFTATDPDNNIATKVVNNGTLTGSTVCFTPVAGINRIIFTVTDSCGSADACTTDVNVSLNSPPVASCPGNSSMFVCNLNQICIPGFTATDPNNNIATKVVSNGTLTGSTVCFTPVAGINRIIFTVTDSCGSADACTTDVNVSLNSPPVASCPGNSSMFVCNLNQICIPGFTATDPNNNIATKVVSNGTLTGSTVCFTPVIGINRIIFTVTDSCGLVDACTTDVNVSLNSPPVASCPGNSSMFVCNLNQICIPGFTATDPNNNIATKVVSNGTLTGSTVCFTPVAGINRIIFTVTDSCGSADACTTDVNVSLNSPPVASCPGNSSMFVCNLNQICIPGFTATDPNNNIATKVVSNGTLTGSTVCFTPVIGINRIIFTVTDSCGLVDACTTDVNVSLNSPPVASCPGNSSMFVCNLNQICIPGFTATDPNNNIATKVVSNGTLTGSTVCFTPVIGINRIIFTVTDSCGLVDACTTDVNVSLNSPPVASCPGNSSMFVCNLNQICIPGFTATDPNNNIATKVVSNGTLTGSTVCFTPVIGINRIIFTVTDSCGLVDACTTDVNVSLNSPPVASCPGNSSMFVCNLNQICIPGFTATDPNNNIATKVVSNGTLTGSTVCFTPVIGINRIIFTVTDSCGLVDACTTDVNVSLNSPPVASCPGNSSMFVCNLNQICIPGFTATDPNNNIATKVVSNGTLTGSTVCFTPVAGINRIIFTVTDSCGLVDACTTDVNVSLNSPPVASCPGNSSMFVCNLNQICIPGFTATDPNNNIATKVVSNGTLTGSTVCFTPVAGINRIIFTVTDSCGLVDACTTDVNVSLNSPPVASCPGNSSMFVCNLNQICIPGFTATDPNNNIATKVVSNGTLTGSTVCFTPVIGINRIIFTVTDSCGLVDACTTDVNVSLNSPPVASCPGNSSMFVCNLNQICIPGFTATDPNNNIATKVVSNGTLTGSTVCFTPVAGNNRIIFTVTDSCGSADACTTDVNVSLNSPPVASCPGNSSMFVCNLNQICIPGFTATDPNNNIATKVVSNSTLTGSTVCFTPVAGINRIIFTVTDSCGSADACTTDVNVIVDPDRCLTGCPVITIEKKHNTIQGQYESVAITIDSMPFGIGGFDLLIQYDASALGLASVEVGSFISGCGWEYFTYRYGASGNCGPNACPTGIVRLIAIGETNNGPNHPDCFQMEPAHLANLVFLVSNDRTLECQYVPIRFIWYDCADNTFSSIEGDSLYISDEVFDYYNGIIWTEISNLSAPFPSWFGANATCDVDPGNGKPAPIRCIDFYNGGIDIVCADSIDDRGDVNLNGLSNEVSDAVLLSNYFIYGISVFTVNLQGQIAASDVNADGTVLSVADLVYLIRIVLGDAQAISKAAVPVNVRLTQSGDGRLSVENQIPIGAAVVIVRGDVQPTLLADGMEVIHYFDGNNTRILVWSISGNAFTGEFLQANGEVTSVEMATAEGNPVNLNVIPTEFALDQNYPNPFNPKTIIRFSLPTASDYKMTIYNVNGQEVASFTGNADNAGAFEIEWSAESYASGIYFYKLVAGNHSQIKKMILLK